jgi:hypothetical protein
MQLDHFKNIIVEAEARTQAQRMTQRFRRIQEARAVDLLSDLGRIEAQLHSQWISLLEDNQYSYADRVQYVQLHEGWWDDLKMYASVLAKPVLNLVAQFNPVTRVGAALINAIDSAMDGKWKDAAQNLAGIIPGGSQLVAAFQAAGDAKGGDVAGFVTSLARAVSTDPTLNAAATAVNAAQLAKKLMPGDEPATQTAAAPSTAQPTQVAAAPQIPAV